MNRTELAELIASRLLEEQDVLAKMWAAEGPVRHCFVDDVLPGGIAERFPTAFPDAADLMLRATIREQKRVGVDVGRYDPLIGEVLHAFQQPAVIEATAVVTGGGPLLGDPSFYASGISVMGRGDFLNPHIDNSHDGDRRLYRALNLLYYVSPAWRRENGGNLELWDPGVRRNITIDSSFNRLVIMETNPVSWHSVSKVQVDQPRYCVSNYLFSASPPGGTPYRHVTTFTGRPEEPLKRATLKVLDGLILNTVDRYLPQLAQRTKHRIKPPGGAR